MITRTFWRHGRMLSSAGAYSRYSLNITKYLKYVYVAVCTCSGSCLRQLSPFKALCFWDPWVTHRRLQPFQETTMDPAGCSPTNRHINCCCHPSVLVMDHPSQSNITTTATIFLGCCESSYFCLPSDNLTWEWKIRQKYIVAEGFSYEMVGVFQPSIVDYRWSVLLTTGEHLKPSPPGPVGMNRDSNPLPWHCCSSFPTDPKKCFSTIQLYGWPSQLTMING